MPIFDPSQVNMDAAAGDQAPDFMQQAATLARQQKMADLLRKIALESRNQPAGQMVSGHYVPTSALEKLLPALDIYKAKQAETQAAGTEAANNAAMQAHANQWRQSAFPQAIAARPEQMGPANPETGSPELAAQPEQPITLGQVLKKTLAAGDNPLLKNQAAAYEKYGTAEVAREDTQRQQKDLLAQQQIVSREKLAEEARRHQDQMTIAAQSDQRAREMQQLSLQMQQQGQTNTAAYHTLMAQIAQQNSDTRKQAADSKPSKPVPQAVVKILSDLSDKADGLADTATSFKPEYGGVGGALSKIGGTYIPMVDSESAKWWKDYQNRAALVERHQMFGTALSAGEQQAWKDATIAPGMTPKVIADNLAKRAALSAKMYDTQLERQKAASAGTYKVEDVFQPKNAKTVSFGDLP